MPVSVSGSTGQLEPSTAGSVTDRSGRLGTDASGPAKVNALVRAPVTERRQVLRCGTSAPKRVSRKRRIDVWSKRFEHTKPPRLNGETTSRGTRKPSPIGPRIPCAAAGRFATVTYSPTVPGGAVTGA